jgi:hypothetical protein
MGRDKDQGKRKEIQSDEDASSEDHDRASDDDYSQPVHSRGPCLKILLLVLLVVLVGTVATPCYGRKC